jgi:hypothetical protein
MLLIDLEEGRIIEDEDIKSRLNEQPYEEWLEAAQYNLKDLEVVEPELAALPTETTSLLDRQQASATRRKTSRSSNRWPSMATIRSVRWAPTRRLPCCRASRACCSIISSRTSRR